MIVRTSTLRRRPEPLELPAGFETEAYANNERLRLLSRLRKTSRQDLSILISKLDSCSEESPCGSGACFCCLRNFRRRWLQECFGILSSGFDCYLVTFIPKGCNVPFGSLNKFDFKALIERERRALQRALGTEVVGRKWKILGGIDLSANMRDNEPVSWQVHFHLVLGIPAGASKQGIRRLFEGRGDESIYRPLLVDSVRDGELAKVVTYTVKAMFGRRSAFRSSTRANSTTFVKTQSLTPAQHIELAEVLDAITTNGRLLIIGARRTWPGGRLRLTAIS